jgi:hypothetical protein
VAGTYTLEVPRGTAPTIDGTLEPDEWRDAAITSMDDGAELRWLVADGLLYLGVRRSGIGSVNLAASEGERVRILHSSAALGSAEYHRQGGDGVWRLERDFQWCCRSTGDAESSQLLFADEGWLASIGYAGERGHVEFRVALPEGDIRVAVSAVDSDGTVAFWPDHLSAVARESLYGVRHVEEQFETEVWMRVVTAE